MQEQGHIWDEGKSRARQHRMAGAHYSNANSLRIHVSDITTRTISDCAATSTIIGITTYRRKDANDSQQTCAPELLPAQSNAPQRQNSIIIATITQHRARNVRIILHRLGDHGRNQRERLSRADWNAAATSERMDP